MHISLTANATPAPEGFRVIPYAVLPFGDDPADTLRDGMPAGLHDLRYYLTDIERGSHNVEVDFWCIALADFMGERQPGANEPTVTPLYARAKIWEVFLEWRASRPSRQTLTALVEDRPIWGGYTDTGDEPGIWVRLGRIV